MSKIHQGAQVFHAGAPLAEATGAIVLLHGRGASAQDILGLSQPLAHEGIAYLAPQAAGHTWYPNSFLAPREANEPWLTSALALVEEVVEATGLPSERVLLAGFSQGACLSTEFVASHAKRYAGLIAFTGGLVGPLGHSVRHEGDLAGTPALFLSGDPDLHVPWVRVEESAAELERMGAVVEMVRYPGKAHTVSPDEVRRAQQFVAQAFAAK